jgi:hypothetical protein
MNQGAQGSTQGYIGSQRGQLYGPNEGMERQSPTNMGNGQAGLSFSDIIGNIAQQMRGNQPIAGPIAGGAGNTNPSMGSFGGGRGFGPIASPLPGGAPLGGQIATSGGVPITGTPPQGGDVSSPGGRGMPGFSPHMVQGGGTQAMGGGFGLPGAAGGVGAGQQNGAPTGAGAFLPNRRM